MAEPSTEQGTEPSDRREVAGFRDALPLLKPYRGRLFLALVIGLLSTAVIAVQPLLISDIVDTYSGEVPLLRVGAVVALLVTGAVLTGIREVLIERTGERFAYDTRESLVRHVYALPVGRLEGRGRADLVSRVTSDVSETRTILTSGLVDLAVSGAAVVLSIAMMAFIDPVLLGLALVAVLLVLFLVFSIGSRMGPVGLRMQTAVGQLAETVSRAIGSMKTIRATGAVDGEADRAVARASEVYAAGRSVAGLRAVIQTVSGVSIQLLLIVVVGLGAVRVASGAISTGDLSAFIMYLMLMVAPVAMVGNVVSMLGEAFGALSRILELRSEPAERDVQSPTAVSRVEEPDDSVLRFDAVSFSYPALSPASHRGEPVLSAVSLSIERGKTTAVVGPSGAGKTTVFSLIERFYEPTDGRILFEGRDVTGMSRKELRSHIAYVDQDAVLLSGTVRYNLTLGSADLSDEACVAALQEVALVSDPAAARLYLDQDVGELGSRLSGGERQRVSIARALLDGAQILLLDEVTSNLDSRSEGLVRELLGSSHPARTSLVIAHRFSTVLSADKIIVLDEGRVVDQGTHGTLMSTSGLYRELAERQFLPETSGST